MRQSVSLATTCHLRAGPLAYIHDGRPPSNRRQMSRRYRSGGQDVSITGGADRVADAIAAIDQGTTSTRCVVFDADAGEIGSAQLEHQQYLERPGYVEHDPEEIWRSTLQVLAAALRTAKLRPSELRGLGIANQRETTVVWDRRDGRPIAPAIVWQDTRSQEIVERMLATGASDLLRTRTGLPLSTYSSVTKLAWVLERVDGAKARARAGELCFGTVDSWLCWKATGRHVTDVINASRTMLMDLETLDWSDDLLELFGVPRLMLPEIVSSSLSPGELACVRDRRWRGSSPVTWRSSATSNRHSLAKGASASVTRRTPTGPGASYS